ncbi:MAG: hypothetical protein MRT15_04130 [archaeon YNP-LCB-003-016]|uniref:hypothetical protein n=1 Tax=Candidatus Culexarchaeum yellowstonense TaxID=2928963 RepID=UPI0026EF46A7|nr:hypothetical protein [Candidatus Culexarchaeum yellowstonense]MCR6691556.1 hypothetical protein [Candidatus Culexarchaeum yellowstonense]
MVAASNPYVKVKTIYSPLNMLESQTHYGIMGAVSEVRKRNGWDWCIEIFLGTIWYACNGDFNKFIRELIATWLEEYLHMIYRWEKGKISREKAPLSDRFYSGSLYEEKIVGLWVRKLLRGRHK